VPRKRQPPNFGFMMCYYRVLRGYSNYRLAKLASLPLTTVLNIEKGSDPKWSTALKLADALGLNIQVFDHGHPDYGGPTPPPRKPRRTASKRSR
jgi:DNA-binding XRE family transcriptional regulator